MAESGLVAEHILVRATINMTGVRCGERVWVDPDGPNIRPLLEGKTPLLVPVVGPKVAPFGEGGPRVAPFEEDAPELTVAVRNGAQPELPEPVAESGYDDEVEPVTAEGEKPSDAADQESASA